MRWCLLATGLLHAVFFLAETLPWPEPFLLRTLLEGAANTESSTDKQSAATGDSSGTREAKKVEVQPVSARALFATVVHNAGIYNAILSGGLFWAFYRGRVANELAMVLCIGVVLAGVFGAATIQSAVCVIQAALGLLTAVLIRRNQNHPV
jgi:uncharacterized membrane protein